MRRLPVPGDATGRVVVITGASSGIGAAAARAITTLGGTVAVVGRTEDRTRRFAAQLGAEAFVADYGHLDEVRDLADRLLARYPRISVLVNNAGGINPRRELTEDGSERTLQESVLGGFLLTELLLPRLLATAEDAPAGSVRVVATASAANLLGRVRLDDLDVERRAWLGGWTAYDQAKLANIVLTRDLARRLAATPVAAYSFHPGLVRTRFGTHTRSFALASALTGGRYGISPEQGAEPLVRLATAAEVGSPSGTYFARLTADGPTSPQARDAALGRRLRRVAEERTGLRPPPRAPRASTP